MSSFDTAWDSIEKEWSPSWRDIVEHEVPQIDDLDLFPWLGMVSTDKFLGEGQDFSAYVHPHDSRFAVKILRDGIWNERTPKPLDYYRNKAGQKFYQDMERMGFPIASEMSMSDGNRKEYMVQPLLGGDNLNYSPELPNWNVAQFALHGAVGDMHSKKNWGYDQKGNIRYLDLDTDKYNTRIVGFEDGEVNQEELDRHNIQIPARRLLDSMDRHGYEDPDYRTFLEAIEPYSENPRTVRVDGKIPWLEGY